MAEVKWIKIATQVFDNRKIKQIERMPEGDAIIVVWFKLLCLAGTCNKNGMIFLTEEVPYTEEMLAIEFGMEQSQRFNVLKLAIRTFQQFKMIEVIDNIYCISSWERYQNVGGLEKIREQNRLRKQKQRENERFLGSHVTCHANVTAGHATDIDIDIDKDINNKYYVQSNDSTENISEEEANRKVTKKQIEDFFESVWKLYPNKKGKGQVSDAKKKILLAIGVEHIARAIDRYNTELKKDDWRKPQNGSTFFNSGYVDYLDENYTPGNAQSTNKGINKFNNFPQREYAGEDFSTLEQKLLRKGVDNIG